MASNGAISIDHQRNTYNRKGNQRNIRLGFVVPQRDTSSSSSRKQQQQQHHQESTHIMNTRDSDFKAQTGTGKPREPTHSNRNPSSDSRLPDNLYLDDNDLFNREDMGRRTSTASTPRVRSEKATTKPIHLGICLNSSSGKILTCD